MKKILLIILTIILIMTFIGCSAGVDKVESKKDEVSYVKGETVMVSHKEVLTGEGWWRRTHYIDDTLYYGISDDSGSYIYTITDYNAPEIKLGPLNMIVSSYVPDTEGNSYFLSMENTEEERTYYLSKVDDDGTEVYRREVPTFAEELLKGGCADAAVSEQGYCVLNGYGTCFVWSPHGEEIVKMEDYWFPEKEMDDYSAGEYGLLNGAEGIYVYHVAGNCIYLQLVDMENQQLCEEITVELPITLNYTIKTAEGGYVPDIKVYSSYEKGIYISDEEKLYAYGGKYAAIFAQPVSNVIAYRDMREAFEGFAQIIGYPNQQGKKAYPIQVSAGLYFGINHLSDHKDAAWEFLEYYIRETAREREINRDVPYPFSILEDTFEIQLYPESNPGVIYQFTNYYTDETYRKYPVITDELRDDLRDMVDNLTWSTSYISSGKIGDIISEELMTFLNGDKSAEEVADIIQSRVSLYMAE